MTDPSSTPADEAAAKARAGERWRRVRGHAVTVGVGVLGVAALAVLRQRDANGPQGSPEEEPAGHFEDVIYHGGTSYFGCRHCGKKKATAYITSHRCCGQCQLGRVHSLAEGIDLDDPERHSFTGTTMYPDACMSCGEPPEAHPWVYSRAYGTRYPSTS
ncbi:hypothetical protein [Streptomyces sp. NPDC060243]|uniref:hypothetical protein n=1 Tax=Streptomyces sp. NPDC060243 TaxID=3347081 RepID=UPI0036493DC6